MHTHAYLHSGSLRLTLIVGAVAVVSMCPSPTTAQSNVGNAQGGSAIQAPPDATVASLFADFLHYAKLGRFTIADAYAKALLAHPELDPVALLDVAHKNRKSIDTLLIIVGNSTIGDDAVAVLGLIEEGENRRRQDLDRIKANIALLAGDPQQEFMATRRLIESGEYAIPYIVETLLDDDSSVSRARIKTALPKIGKAAVNPLVMALRVADSHVRLILIAALGEIGYPQAIPYLLKIKRDDSTPADAVEAADRAIARIERITGRSWPGSAEEHFFGLGDAYFDELSAVRADPRLQEANVWYWDESDQRLSRVVVPQRIFGQVMAMRCCEEALRLQNDHAGAIALWLASNVRRESRLGLDVESGDASATGEPDPTRPAEFPRALYFTQAAGPRYGHLVLERAVANNDSAIALGAIEALRVTAGATSLVGTEDVKQPLVQALRFPDTVVRIRAALALGAALPRDAFADAEFVVPVLAGALTLTDQQQVVVVDPDASNLNRVVGAFRSSGMAVIGESSFYKAMARARTEFQTVSGFVIATNVSDPELPAVLADLRNEFTYAGVPVVLLTKQGQSLLSEEATSVFQNVEAIEADADEQAIEDALTRASDRAGRSALDADLALSLAKASARTLRSIVVDGRTVFDAGGSEPHLIAALDSTDESLQTLAASVLALLNTPSAQRSVAHVALDSDQTNSLREAVFGALAESAKNHGNLLDPAQIAELVRISRDEDDLAIRTAASKALGAINLATDQASDIVRKYYGG